MLMRVLELSMGVEAAIMGVEVESWVVRDISREVVDYPTCVTL